MFGTSCRGCRCYAVLLIKKLKNQILYLVITEHYTTLHTTDMAAQTKVFRLTSITLDLIESVKSIATAEPHLIVLDAMPDERDRMNQQVIVLACSVLTLIDEEMMNIMKNNPGPVTRQMHSIMTDAYGELCIFLGFRFIDMRFNIHNSPAHLRNESSYCVCYHLRNESSYPVCYHGDDWIARIKCNAFRPRLWVPELRFDSRTWLNLVTECNKEARTKLYLYKMRYFVRSYFFLALDCSAPVVESIDTVLLYMFKN